MMNIFKTKKKKMPTSAEMTSKEIMSIIREEGYFPHLEDDGDVSFKIKGTTFTFGTCAKGFVYGRIYYHLKVEDKWPAILAAQHVELTYVAIKVLVVPDSNSLIFSVESLCATSEAFRSFFNRTLSILADSIGAFSDKFREYDASEECIDRECQEAVHIKRDLSGKTTLS